MRNITVNGRLSADVVRQISKQGSEYINFSIANNEYGDEKSSDGQPLTQWFRVTSFLPQHVKLAQYLTKGKPIIITGHYSNRLYQNQKTGQWNISNDIIATDINFEIGSERQNTTNGGSAVASPTKVAQNIDKAVDEIPQATSRRMAQPTTQPTVAPSADDDDDLPF